MPPMITNHVNNSSMRRSSGRDGPLLRPMNAKDDDSKAKGGDDATPRPRARPRSPSFVRTADQQASPERSTTPLRRRVPNIETTSGQKSPLRVTNKSPIKTRDSNTTSQTRDQLSPLRSTKKDQDATVAKKTRRHRTSFQGLGIVQKKGSNVDSNNIIDAAKVEKMRGERRLKSMDIMRNSAQTDQIRNILETTLDECMKQSKMEQSPEERIQAVMTRAKEQGMSTEDIFSFFNGGNPNTTKITKASFLAAIDKLGNGLQHITEDELDAIVDKFDKNGDGQICIDEFKNYCYYQITSVAWKAERTRLEASGEMQKIRAQLSRRFTATETNTSEIADEIACGDEVHRTSKFFWKSNNNVEIRMYFTGEMNVITIQLYSQTFEKEIPAIYVCKNKLDVQYEGLKEDTAKALALAGSQESNEKKVTWQIIAGYILSRLQLKDGPKEEIVEDGFPIDECSHIPKDAMLVPCICKLEGDTYDTLMIQKPLNLSPPTPITSSDKITDNFDKKMESFYNVTRKARLSRRSAEDLSNVISAALSDAKEADSEQT